MAANRTQTMVQALKSVWARGGIAGFYQGLIPWVRPLRLSRCSVRAQAQLYAHFHRLGLRLRPRVLSSCLPPRKLRRGRLTWVCPRPRLVCLGAWVVASPRRMRPWVRAFDLEYNCPTASEQGCFFLVGISMAKASSEQASVPA